MNGASAACASREGPPPGTPTASAVLDQAAKENFPVASRLLPRAERDHLMALYGFARMVDDIGDEADGDRAALLDWVAGELDLVYLGSPAAQPTHALMRTLADSVRALDLPRDPFERLIEANRREQEVRRIASYEELIESCRLSAMPVGELVLHVFGAATPERVALSDDVCAGLQLVEHLQDVREDRLRGHVYLPQADMRRCGAVLSDLDAERPSTSLRAVLMIETRRARQLLAAGIPLIRSLAPRPGFAVAAFVAGGRAALDAIENAGYDVLGRQPRPSNVGLARAFGRTLRQAGSPTDWGTP